MKLPVVTIPLPCDQPWETMAGNEYSRFCDRCQKQVVNLTALTDQQVAVVAGQLPCVRVVKNASGALVTRTTRRQQLVALLRGLARQRKATP